MPAIPAPMKPKRVHKDLAWSEMDFNVAVYSDRMKVKRKSPYELPKPPKKENGEYMTWDEAYKANPKAVFRLLKGSVKKQARLNQFQRVLNWNGQHPDGPFKMDVPVGLLVTLTRVGPLSQAGWKWNEQEEVMAQAYAELARLKKCSNILINFMLKTAKPGTPITTITNKVYALVTKQAGRSPMMRFAEMANRL